MNYKLIIKPEAENDLDEAIEWYKEQNENLPSQLLNEVETGLNNIQKYPEHYQKDIKRLELLLLKSSLTEFIIL